MAQSQDSKKEGIAVHPSPFARETLQLCPFLRNQSRIGVDTVENMVSKSVADLRRDNGRRQKRLTWTEVGAQARAAVRRHCRRAGAKERTANILNNLAAGTLSQIICRKVFGEGGCRK